MTHRTDPGSHLTLAARSYEHGTRGCYVQNKCRCFKCRRANTAYYHVRQADPRIDATPTREHIAWLRSKGVGLRAISDATDITRQALKRLTLGQPTVLRSVSERILNTDEQAIADSALIDARPTQWLLRQLVQEGYTKTRLATLLGSESRVPALQFQKGRVLAKTALRVRRLYDALTAESHDTVEPLSRRERILAALRWFDSVTAEDLFDAMGVGSDNTHMKALERLVSDGSVTRTGEKPYRYRRAA